MTAVRIPFLSAALHEDAAAVRTAVERVLSSGWFILGPEVDAFEHEFATAAGAGHAVGVGTGYTKTLQLVGTGKHARFR